MSPLQIKTTRWAIASRYREGRALYWSHRVYHVSPNFYKTRASARQECEVMNELMAGTSQTFYPVSVSVVITEIKTKKGKT